MKHFQLFAFLLLMSEAATAQEFNFFGLLGKNKPLKLTGDVTASTVFNYTSDNSSLRAPLTYVLGANLNCFWKGINVPVSFVYVNGAAQTSIQPPFSLNQFAIHPKKKWVQLHLGTTSLSYSPYALNGHQFVGGGVDLTPKKLQISAMYGRLLRGSGDYLAKPNVIPAFQRMGMAARVKYTDQFFTIGTSVFHAKDRFGSAFNTPADVALTPKENMTATFDGSLTLLKTIRISGEYARNYLTTDRSIDAQLDKGLITRGLMGVNGSTVVQEAYKVQVGWTWKTMDLGIDFERIDPRYTSLGAYYNLNGFENTLLRAAFSLFKSKVSVNSSAGFQKDITDNSSAQKSRRVVSSLGLNFNPTTKLSIAANFNNFNSVTDVRNIDVISAANNVVPPYLDSLRLLMINLNSSVNCTYQLGSSEESSKMLMGSYMLNNTTQKKGDYFVDRQAAQIHTGIVQLMSSNNTTSVQWTAGLCYNSSMVGKNDVTISYGPDCSIGRTFANKSIPVVVGSSFNTTTNRQTGLIANVFNLRLIAGYKYKTKHDFRLSGIMQTRASKTATTTATNVTNLLTTLNYSYAF